jgi:hypothetical protein
MGPERAAYNPSNLPLDVLFGEMQLWGRSVNKKKQSLERGGAQQQTHTHSRGQTN